jgi:drug/metabolite transporter (DMT)-like permease
VFTGLARLGGTPISRRWQLATATAIAGTGLLTLHEVHCSRQVVLGIGLAILTGIACALFTVASTRVIAPNGSTSTTMALVLGTAGLAMSPLLLTAQPPGCSPGPGAPSCSTSDW